MASFVDTNILVYAEDRDAGRKHDLARDLIVELWARRDGVVSVQVLQEFYVTATRKLKRPLSSAKALEVVEEYLTWQVVENTGALLRSAIGLQQRAQLSFWDAMIVQAAIDAGCSELYSEDLNAGQRFGPVRVVNPFRTQVLMGKPKTRNVRSRPKRAAATEGIRSPVRPVFS